MHVRSRASTDGQVAVPLLDLQQQEEASISAIDTEVQREQPEIGHHTTDEAVPSISKSWRAAPSTIKDQLVGLLPSFIIYKYFRTQNTSDPTGRWHPTVFLDGLRGVACMTVFHLHILNLLDGWHWNGWGFSKHDDKLIQLPLVRLLYSGNLAVNIFFVISGFALSVSTVKLMQAQHRDLAAFGKSVTSAIFRRPIRLFLPAWASTVLPFFYFQLGIYAAVEPMRSSKMFDGLSRNHEAMDTFWLQVKDFVRQDLRMLNIFRLAPHNRYNGPTWTIPVEFRASLILYLTHAALFSVQRKFRFSILACGMVIALAFEQTDLPLFWAGFIIAECFFLKAEKKEMLEHIPSSSSTKSMITTILTTALFILALWVGSFPENGGRESPGYMWLSTFKPPKTFTSPQWWRIVGATGIVGVICFCPDSSDPTTNSYLSRLTSAPKTFLSSPLCRYLGKISYGLYLSHYLVLDTFGILCFYSIFSITGTENPFLYILGFFFSYALILCMVLWVADLFWRFVDQPCVRFAKWVEHRLMAS